MAIHRRRYHNNNNNKRFRYIIPLISLTILFIYAFISLLAPSPDHLHHRPLRRTTLSDDDDEVINVSKRLPSIFKVPISGGMMSERNLWSTRMSKFYYGCSNASVKFPKVETVTYPNRYLMIATSGGLNQQRTGITDAVVAARILNATLVIPKLDQKSFWKDSSTFSEIFDVEWFISRLSKDVKVIKELPRKGGKVWVPYNMRVPRKCNERCYQIRVLPVLLKKHAVQLSKFDYRLSNKLETDLQKLRCRVNYHALKFTDPINKMGQKLVNRMRKMGKHYVALHLRFEPDMLAFSGCYYGGGEKERKELGKIRKRWKTLHSNNPDKERRQGRCPLTPEEVGLMLRALGYSKDVHLYVASGEVYGGDETLEPLRALFPNIHSKDTIATKAEVEPFSTFSSRMATLDFIVCDESDVFVTDPAIGPCSICYKNYYQPKYLTINNETFTQQKDLAPFVTDLMTQIKDTVVIGYSRGLLCLHAFDKGGMLVLWNPSVKRSVGILPVGQLSVFGFAVCPVTNETTIVGISFPWKVQIFTLSSNKWSEIQCRKPRESFAPLMLPQVVIGSCIFRLAHEKTVLPNGHVTLQLMIVSFDLVAQQFSAIDLPDHITNPSTRLTLSMLNGSLVVIVPHSEVKVWKMEPDSSFTLLFTVASTPASSITSIVGFRKNGQLVFQTQDRHRVEEELSLLDYYDPCHRQIDDHALNVYDPCSRRINDLGFSGQDGSLFLGSFKETLHLLDHSDSSIYPEIN